LGRVPARGLLADGAPLGSLKTDYTLFTFWLVLMSRVLVLPEAVREVHDNKRVGYYLWVSARTCHQTILRIIGSNETRTRQFRARPVFVGGLSIAIGAAGSGWRWPIDIQKRTSFTHTTLCAAFEDGTTVWAFALAPRTGRPFSLKRMFLPVGDKNSAARLGAVTCRYAADFR